MTVPARCKEGKIAFLSGSLLPLLSAPVRLHIQWNTTYTEKHGKKKILHHREYREKKEKNGAFPISIYPL